MMLSSKIVLMGTCYEKECLSCYGSAPDYEVAIWDIEDPRFSVSYDTGNSAYSHYFFNSTEEIVTAGYAVTIG